MLSSFLPCVKVQESAPLHDPPMLNPKGRPCHTRHLTGALEGRARGGGGRKRSSTSAGVLMGVSKLQNVGGQTDAVSADRMA